MLKNNNLTFDYLVPDHRTSDIDQELDLEWRMFLNQDTNTDINYDTNKYDTNTSKPNLFNEKNSNVECEYPKPSDIYISTKSKIAFIDTHIDLNIFWDIPVIPFNTHANGIIKKQIKTCSKNLEELQNIKNKLSNELYYEELIITHIDNPNGRIRFKDIRKISIGISKKDIIGVQSKKKQAFYNCFVIILRIKIENIFKEFHIKIFNTGKIEIPGLQNDENFVLVLNYVVELFSNILQKKITYNQDFVTVLINSNFNCGFNINREVLYNILKNKYQIQTIYDPCSYPGIQCKFYYDKNKEIQNGISDISTKMTKKMLKKNPDIYVVSFMIFRTGSVLIVGMCDDNILYNIYEFIKQVLQNEFPHICQKIHEKNQTPQKKQRSYRNKKVFICKN